jgi:hypothetical protein
MSNTSNSLGRQGAGYMEAGLPVDLLMVYLGSETMPLLY